MCPAMDCFTDAIFVDINTLKYMVNTSSKHETANVW